jgi:hypothetical protein
MSSIIEIKKFNFYVYVISGSKDGPVKIGFSNNPYSRLKDLQTGNPQKLFICGTLGFKEKYPAELVEKLLHQHLTNNNVRAEGEWFYINAKEAVLMLHCFPQGREDIFKKLEINDTKIINGIHLIDNASVNEFLSEEECELLYDIFERGDDDLYEFQDYTGLLKVS